MLLAWIEPELRDTCTRGKSLDSVAGEWSLAARDLITVVAHASNLGGLIVLRSIVTTPDHPGLILSLEEVYMHTRLLHPDGRVQKIRTGERLAAHASVNSIVVDDVLIGHHSLRQRAGS
jgi:hypothetical protein